MTIEVMLNAMGANNLLRRVNKNTGKDDSVFALSEGSTTNVRGIYFSTRMKAVQITNSSLTLYSLRHTYITHQLLAGVPLPVIATRCGTSAATIEQHYKHVAPMQFAELLQQANPKGVLKEWHYLN